jgi:hydroxyethylthiazole kinase
MLGQMLENVQEKTPLVHNITNYVTVNDCANILLACGASPIMADDMGEAADITSICNALNINIGTLNKNTIPSMLAAGVKSNTLGHPVLLDPVGAGASKLRTETALNLLKEIHFTVIRGNVSEIKTLVTGSGATKGVDANAVDMVTEANLGQAVAWVKDFAAKMGCVVAVTGAIDIVADAKKAYVIRNGHPIMSRITGSGCMLSSMMTAYLAANPDTPLEAAAASVCAMGLAGEMAAIRMKQGDGNGSFRTYLLDAIYNLDKETLDKGARYEVR